MRFRLLMPLFVLSSALACSRVSEPAAAAPTGFVPDLSPRSHVELLPGDLVSWVQANPPRLTVNLLGVAAGEQQLAELIAVLAQRVTVVVGGKPVPVKTAAVGLPLQRELGAEELDPPGLEASPLAKLGSGWHQLELDVSGLPLDASWLDQPKGGKLIARFNVESAPTVRRVWLCPGLGQLRIAFSEPMKTTAAVSKSVTLADEKGNPVGCALGLDAAKLDAAGELLSVQCENPLPRALQLGLSPGGFEAPASGKPVLDLEGKPFARVLYTEAMPDAAIGDSDCRVLVP